ncbi:MAG: MaoC family dehydratase N-terminal domain-containing protein [Nocardioides sp.]|nr:MaoC family dehydratase N-terminal domain-containing protein [Nocardioides sp.]
MTRLPSVGDVGHAFEFPIELGKVREFARATKAGHPSYVCLNGGPLVIPPTFLTSAAWWIPADGGVLNVLADDWSRLLHGGQRYVFHGSPPSSGDRLVATQRIRDVTERTGRRAGRMTFIDWSTDFVDGEGVLRAEELHLTILTERPPGGSATAGDLRARPDLGSSGHGPTLEELVDNRVSMTDIVRYQGASGDLNPIHHDHELAKAAGHRSAFSVGMLHAGILGSHVGTVFGPENVREFGVRFKEQVWPGDQLAYGGRVVDRQEVAGERLLTLDLEVRRSDGRVPLTGQARVVDAGS